MIDCRYEPISPGDMVRFGSIERRWECKLTNETYKGDIHPVEEAIKAEFDKSYGVVEIRAVDGTVEVRVNLE